MPKEADYRALKQRVTDAGLLDRQLAYYVVRGLLTLALYGASTALLFVVAGHWSKLAVAPLLALAWGQTMLLGHDAGHGQTSGSGRVNDIACLLLGPTLVGVSRNWWIPKHNRHHSHPNQLGHDPDVEFGTIAFTQDQARSRRGVIRLIVRHQAALFVPLLSLEAYSLRVVGILHVLRNRQRLRLFDGAALALNTAGYLTIVFWALGLWPGLVFIVIHQGLFGLYVGSVFAPNHKGMLMLGEDEKIDFFRRQVLTARNVKGSPLRDFWYGGLNYQIEHHLFPTMPRNRLRKAQAIVKAFCAERRVPYYETGLLRSYREIFGHLREASAPLRRSGVATELPAPRS